MRFRAASLTGRGFYFLAAAGTITPVNSIEDFYCEEVLSGSTPVQKVLENESVLAYHHPPVLGNPHRRYPEAHVAS
jgi:hypothetical protein